MEGDGRPSPTGGSASTSRPVTREGARRGAANSAQSGQTGTSLRRDEPRSREGAVTVRPGEAAIAKRMGIKDPQKAKERFLERQKSGQSALGAVSGFVHEEDF